MKKKILSLLFVFALCLLLAMPAFAEETESSSYEYSRLMDEANLLSDSEKTQLLEKLDEISERQKLDVVVATVDNLADYTEIRDLADDIYDYCNFGYGDNRDGVLLLISAEERKWYISTCGYGITAFTDAGIDYIGGKMKSNLSDKNYNAAFNIFVEQCDDFITKAKNGTPYDTANLPFEPLSWIWIPISAAVGLIFALIIVSFMKDKLKSVRREPAADSYVRNGSMNVTESRDLFLYNTVSRTEIPKNDSSSGSSTHTSSSGTTHGGGGGSF